MGGEATGSSYTCVFRYGCPSDSDTGNTYPRSRDPNPDFDCEFNTDTDTDFDLEFNRIGRGLEYVLTHAAARLGLLVQPSAHPARLTRFIPSQRPDPAPPSLARGKVRAGPRTPDNRIPRYLQIVKPRTIVQRSQRRK
jgi:hypothetical protein